ncbi:hypothetical protein [Hymenobacter volaticus]|uniref:Lipoprotein n=1 Tax=Hymenobacter volaticus TaxID=2932254 RepID=A0ABY4GFL1_9BACT|nr:hypothetical protein [Hymenobacter volaticus]UOQ69730.1 hypothetical protein MUN86_29915 [Hymenobacter volaticus]
MRLLTLIAASLLVSALPACQFNSEAKAESKDARPATSQNYLKVTFDGKTTLYRDVRFSEAQMGSIKGWQICTGSSGDNHLTVFVYGTKAGSFPYRKDMNSYAQVSQVDYQTQGTKFANYKAVVCPTESGYYSTDGAVNVTEYVAGKVAKGTFTGALLDQNDEDMCAKTGKPFSGEFSVVEN